MEPFMRNQYGNADADEISALLMSFRKKEPYARKPWNKRYSNAIKQMMPIRGPSKDPHPVMPGPSRGFLSLFSLHWMSGLMWKAFRGKLDKDDIWKLRKEDSSFLNCERLERHWAEELCRRGPKAASLSKVVIRTYRSRILVASIFMCIAVVLQFIGPSILLKMMLDYANDLDAPYSRGIYILVLIVICQLGRCYCFYGFSFVTSTFSCFRASGGLQLMIYRKLLRLRITSDQVLGKVVNICINDMERLFEAFTTAPFVLAALVMFVFAMTFNLWMIGPWSLVGFGIIFLSYPILGGLAAVTSVLRAAIVQDTDRRVKLVSEILGAIRLIKMYAWEDSFRAKVYELRADEHKMLEKAAFLQSLANTVSPFVAVLGILATILGYVLRGNELTAEAAFTTFAVFNAMQFSIGTLPYGVKMVTEVHVALRRTKELMLMPEIPMGPKPANSEMAIAMDGATFAWEKPADSKSKAEKKREKRRAKDGQDASSKPTTETISGIGGLTKSSSTSNTKSLDNDTAGVIKSTPNLSPSHAVPINGGGLKRSASGCAEPDSLDTDTVVMKSRGDMAGSFVSEKSGSSGGDDIGADNKPESITTLFDVSLQIESGKLIGVAGSVGAGKSSLLGAIMGQLRLQSGDIRVSGRLAVVSQTAWIFSGTVRDNILFGAPMAEERYNQVLDVCALRTDLELMDNGDLSEIGERGINLSGGQKQRVNLARAVYSHADILLMDDPLSAVDSKVGKHIFNHCIRGFLSGKTVLLVSHGVQYLSQCDEVLMLVEGRLTERGTHAALMQRQADYHSLVSYDKAHAHAGDKPPEQQLTSSPTQQEGEKSGRPMTTEETLHHQYGFFRLVYLYIKPAGLGLMLLVMLMIALFGISRTSNGIYLQYWLDQGDGRREERLHNMTEYNATYTPQQLIGVINYNPDLNMHILYFCLLFGIMLVLGFIKGGSYAFKIIKGTTAVHNRMFDGLVRCKMSFFDANPAGRILNRFSRDMDELDSRISMLFEFLLQSLVLVLVQFLVPTVSFPVYILLVAVVFVMYGMLGRGLISGIRETKSVENVSRSPVLHHITSTIAGLPIIRTFAREEVFAERFEHLLDTHTAANMQFRLASMWFCLRLDELGCIMMFAVALFVVFQRSASPAMVGLILSLVYGSITFISFLIRMSAEMSARLTSVARCDEYIQSLDYEAPVHLPERAPPADWPQQGVVELRDVSLRYRPDLPRVLHNVRLVLRAGEKVGVVGRTGAGKSTLISTLLRMAEVESGQVLVDGVDIALIGLHDLRKKIDVIPQDPVLFSGTIRFNLDPFEEYTDEKLWAVLEKANLKKKVQRGDQQLLMKVSSDGDNFSVGERQLICLARALLRENRVLLLDEATASVDVETDRLIQRVIQTEFARCTVITIAHRLNTVAGYDRVVVMDAGRVVECDSPIALMEKEGSLFYQMMAHAGFTTVDQLKQLRS